MRIVAALPVAKWSALGQGGAALSLKDLRERSSRLDDEGVAISSKPLLGIRLDSCPNRIRSRGTKFLDGEAFSKRHTILTSSATATRGPGPAADPCLRRPLPADSRMDGSREQAEPSCSAGTAVLTSTTVEESQRQRRRQTAEPVLSEHQSFASSHSHLPAQFQFQIGPSVNGTQVHSLQSTESNCLSPAPSAVAARPPSLLVFSGGTAFNGVVEELKKLTTSVVHVLPVSDDGGSTSEIVRVLGGPAIGDIRSRCLRLSDGTTAEALAVKQLLGHRLPLNPSEAKTEWLSIVEGEHELWENVSEPYKDTIRAFLVHFQHQILQHAADKFCFQNGSVGNFFFAGARTFFRSLDAAIFLFSRVSHIPPESLVLPCICTNDRLTLGAELLDGTIIRGQHEISHPTVKESPVELARPVDKGSTPPLPSPIKRLFYISSEGVNFLHEVYPQVNPRVVEQLKMVDAVIYGVGSLYTSICPSLVLRGVGEAIAARRCPKILMLNGMYDRETDGMLASDFVLAVSNSLNRRHGEDSFSRLHHAPSAYVTVLLAPVGGDIPVDFERLQHLGVERVVMVDSTRHESGSALFDEKALIAALHAVVCRSVPVDAPALSGERE